jgi:hypothetical protein
MNRLIVVYLLAVGGVCLLGCGVYRAQPLPLARYYYLTPDKDLATVGRVDIVEFINESSNPQISGEITRAVFQALQKEQMFGLRLFTLEDTEWKSLLLTPDTSYSLEELQAIRDTLRSDAIITGTVADYQPFPHMSMSLRLSMIDLREGKLLWAVDHTWDTADKETQERIRRYFKNEVRAGYQPLREDLVSISPIEFNKFVAYEVVQTLDGGD